MGVGTITGVIDTLTFDAGRCDFPHVINISGNVFAIAYGGPDWDGWLATLTIDADGTIGAVIDTLEFDAAAARDPFIFHVSGDIYGIAYRGTDDDGFLVTVDIDSAGNIGAAVIDMLEFDTVRANSPFVVPVSGDIFAIAYGGPAFGEIKLRTVDIDPTGTPISIVDTASQLAVAGQGPAIIHVSGTVYAILYRTTIAGIIMTRTISSSGTIGAVITEFTYTATVGDKPHIVAISGDIFAIVYQGPFIDGFLQTVDIDPTGTPISIVATLEYDTGRGIRNTITPLIGTTYAIAYTGVDDDGFLKTVDIPASGTPLTLLDSLEFDTAFGANPWPVLIRGPDPGVVALAYSTTGYAGVVATIGISTIPRGMKGLNPAMQLLL